MLMEGTHMTDPRCIVTFEKNGKQSHAIIRCLPHDPQPVVGKRFGRHGIVVAVKAMEGSN